MLTTGMGTKTDAGDASFTKFRTLEANVAGHCMAPERQRRGAFGRSQNRSNEEACAPLFDSEPWRDASFTHVNELVVPDNVALHFQSTLHIVVRFRMRRLSRRFPNC